MTKEIWHKRFLYARDRLCFYPVPEPLQHTRKFWLVMGLVSVAILCFCAFYISYICARQIAFQTNAEDFGIMDQAIWNTIHGSILHETICNIVSDKNCVSPAGYMRFAIHFEPILFPISLFYFIWSDPRILLVVQTIVVAIGAYPAFWLARLRLRNDWWAGAVALLYLVYPAQLQATTYDFHAVTLTAALLLFTLYFMYTRQTLWFFIFAILSMACKESIPLVMAAIGLWTIVFQRRWKSGSALILLAGIWFIVATKVIMPYFSPTGDALLISRYSGTGGLGGIARNLVFHPITFLRTYVFEPTHLAYIHSLLAPAGYIPKPHGGGIFYLPLLAPWILIMAVPSIAVNLLSSNPQQYTGLFQYNADIVPVIIFSTIEALVVVQWLLRIGVATLARRQATNLELTSRSTAVIWRDDSSLGWRRIIPAVLISLLLVGVISSALRTDYYFHGQLPFSIGFQWPQSSAHTVLAQHFIDMIPSEASVSAQTKLVPHLSQRKSIYMFPYDDMQADYVFLDVTGDIYPYSTSQPYISAVKHVLASGKYGVVAAQDGYLLLKRGLPAPHALSAPGTSRNTPQKTDPTMSLLFDLPVSFCSNIYVSQQQVTHPLQVDFKQTDGNKLHLLGFAVGASSPFSRANGYGTLTTYWRVDNPMKTPIQLLAFMRGSDGREYLTHADMPDLSWCPAETWQPGAIVRLTSRTFNLQQSRIPNGLAQMSIAILSQVQSSSTMEDMSARLTLQILHAPDIVTVSENTNALQLMPLTIVN